MFRVIIYEIFFHKHTEKSQSLLKVAYFLRKLESSPVNKSIVLRINDATFSGYSICMNLFR